MAALNVVPLSALLQSAYENKKFSDKKSAEQAVEELLIEFKSKNFSGSDSQHDVESFLHKKAIAYDKQGLSKTHLIFTSYKNEQVLVGYFAIANQPLVFTPRMLKKFSNTQISKLKQKGKNLTSDSRVSNLIISAFLIGQIGKNFSENAINANAISGTQILTLAYEAIQEAQLIAGGSYVWIEYEDIDKLRTLYSKFGFNEVKDYTSENGLKLAFMKIS